MRRKIVAANWKMNKDVQESYEFTKELVKKLLNIKKTEVILFPPFTSLFYVSEVLKSAPIKLGGQNMYFEKSGAFTGEISGSMLKSANCQYVILGHSERRHIFNESNEMTKRKVDAALESDLKPIVCVGETLEERKAGKTMDVIREQYYSAFANVAESQTSDVVIAYEPVWAIGTGVNATPEQASETHSLIRNLVREQYDEDVSESLPILYGGSVKPDNAADLIKAKDIDGFLVGGASLKVDSFCEIVKTVEDYL